MTNEEMTPDAALAALPERLRNPRGPVLPSEEEAKEFHNKVDEVTRLIECLKEGTIPPEYVDRKIQEEEQKKEEEKRKEQERKKKEEEDKKLTPEREAALRERAAELEASYKRKQRQGGAGRISDAAVACGRPRGDPYTLCPCNRARARFEEYVQTAEAKKSSTDYERWDMWCPSDDEDELINKLTLPNTAEFKAMEKDIDERHRRWFLRHPAPVQKPIARSPGTGNVPGSRPPQWIPKTPFVCPPVHPPTVPGDSASSACFARQRPSALS